MEKTIYQVVMYKQVGSLRAHRNVLLETESLNEAVEASEPFIDGAQDNSFSGLCKLKYDGYTYEVVEDLDD